MKVFSDRNTIKWLIQFGLMFAICGGSLAKSNSWMITIGLLGSIIITTIISALKNYRNIVFIDEKYPEQASPGTNIIVSIIFSISYVFSIILFYIITDNLNYDINWNIWALIINIIYFVSVFICFISKIDTKQQ
jgi:uncharacterized membrane protein YhhN